MKTTLPDGIYNPMDDKVFAAFRDIVIQNRRDRTVVHVLNGEATARRVDGYLSVSRSSEKSLAEAGAKVVDADTFLSPMMTARVGAKSPVAHATPSAPVKRSVLPPLDDVDADIRADLEGESLESLSRKDLVAMAKAQGVKASGKNDEIISRLRGDQ